MEPASTGETSWLPVALSVDVPAGVAAPVLLQGRELVLWRSAGGRIQAWEDRCPHRGMRLSFGFVRGEALACLYHGWRFGADAACTAIPAHPDLTPPATLRANAFACAEAGGLVFVADAGILTPPELPEDWAGRDWAPVRSIALAASHRTAMTALVAQAETIGTFHCIVLAEGARLLVAVQPTDTERTTLHGLAEGSPAPAVLGEAADWIEAFARALAVPAAAA